MFGIFLGFGIFFGYVWDILGIFLGKIARYKDFSVGKPAWASRRDAQLVPSIRIADDLHTRCLNQSARRLGDISVPLRTKAQGADARAAGEQVLSASWVVARKTISPTCVRLSIVDPIKGAYARS